MSELLKQNGNFIDLVLSTPKRLQAVALLDTATPDQVRTLAEIARNVLHLPLSPEARLTINKRRHLLEKLSNQKLSTRRKADLISKHHRLILEVLHAIKVPLQELMK